MPIPTPSRATLVNLISFICLITFPLWIYFLLFPKGYDFASGIVVFFVIVLLDMALIMHVSRTDGELRKIMVAGLFFKFLAAAAYLTVALHFWQGGDFMFYFDQGSNIAASLRNNGEIGSIAGVTSHTEMNGTTLLHIITGFVFVIMGPTLSGGIVFFSSVAYWGVFLFWRAFATAFPGGDSKTTAALLFFLPSIVFWSSTIGKDALLSLTIGLTAYGLARVLYGGRFSGFGYMTAGVLGTGAIRPHIGAILGMSLAVIYLLGRNRAGLPGVLARLIGIPLIIVGTYYTFSQAKERLGLQDTEHAQQYLTDWNENTAYGGSSFQGGSLAVRALTAPALPFRPFPWEVNSVQTLISSLEGMVLLLLFWINRRSLMFSLSHWRSHPFVGFIVFYSLETAVALSCAFSNFGLLARERVMFTPLLLMLIAAFPVQQFAPSRVVRPAFQFGRVS